MTVRRKRSRAALTPVAGEAALPNWIPLKVMTPEQAARIHAAEIHSIWGVSEPQPLGDAHRLLDVDTLAKVVLTLMVRMARENGRTFPASDASGHYYRFPHWPKLLPALQQWTWGQILKGKLVLTGIPTDNLLTGDHTVISPERLRFLQPDWANAILRAEGRAFVHDVAVVLPPAPAGASKAKRRHVPDAELQHCGKQIKEKWPANEKLPTEKAFQKLIEASVGGRVTRDRLRQLQRDLGLMREPGRSRKNSPK
jgi:hypothetical protein